MDKIPLETNEGEFQVRFRDCFSVRYIQAASLLCRLGYEVETGVTGTCEIPSELVLRHEAFVLNSILSSVAFLESNINELYADAADNAYYFSDPDHEALLRTIGERWQNEKNFDRAPMATKYQRILAIAEREQFCESDPVFTDILTLIEIRNYLMHYKREWIVVVNDSSCGTARETGGEKLGNYLRDRFALNPLAHPRAPFFPDQCLGFGCAEWAVNQSLAFTDEFFRRLDLPAPYEGIRKDLATK